MLRSELSSQELALESAELLPDRDTMQVVVIGEFAANAASITQTATWGALTGVEVEGSGDATMARYAANYAEVTQYATPGDAGGR